MSPGLPLKVAQVTKRYGRKTVADDSTFTVEPGRATGFLGPDESGKSNTMKILLDLAAADAGHTSIGGVRFGVAGCWDGHTAGSMTPPCGTGLRALAR